MLLLLAAVLTVTACEPATGRFQTRPRALASSKPNIVHFDGLGRVPFGGQRDELTNLDLIIKGDAGCNGAITYDVPGYADHADLVFDGDGRFSLAWIYSPRITTRGKVGVGSGVDDVRAEFPDASDQPASSHSYPGILAHSGDRAILFLYDPSVGEVMTILAGYTEILQKTQSAGLSC